MNESRYPGWNKKKNAIALYKMACEGEPGKTCAQFVGDENSKLVECEGKRLPMNRMKEWLAKIYQPHPALWKRKVLFWLSATLVGLVAAAGYSQYVYSYAGIELWWLIGMFGVLGLTGLLISIFGSEWWVAMFLGRR